MSLSCLVGRVTVLVEDSTRTCLTLSGPVRRLTFGVDSRFCMTLSGPVGRLTFAVEGSRTSITLSGPIGSLTFTVEVVELNIK